MDRTAELMAGIAAVNEALANLSVKVGELPAAISKEAEELKALIEELEQGDTVDAPAVIASLQVAVANIEAISASISEAKAGIDAIVDSAPMTEETTPVELPVE